MRAGISSSGVYTTGSTLSWDSDEAILQLIMTVAPRIVLTATSYQSPWELGGPRSRWNDMIHAAGFGITIPLQAPLTVKVARAIRDCHSKALLVNACYPDAVNPLLRALDLEVFCGIGNIAILAAAVKSRTTDRRSTRLLAHHYHVSLLQNTRGLIAAKCLPRLWTRKGHTVKKVLSSLRALRAIHGAELNHVTGCHAASLVTRILLGQGFLSHVPGPRGLPGGYPVFIQDRAIALDLPESVTTEEAVNYNMEWSELDGVVIDASGIVRFSDRAITAIRNVWSGAPEQFPAHQIGQVCQEFLTIKDRLSKIA